MLPLENRLSSRSDTGREELLPGVRAHLCGSHLSVRSTVCPRSRCERSLGHCPPSGPRISGNWSCGSAVAAAMRGAAWEMEFNPTEDPPPPSPRHDVSTDADPSVWSVRALALTDQSHKPHPGHLSHVTAPSLHSPCGGREGTGVPIYRFCVVVLY